MRSPADCSIVCFSGATGSFGARSLRCDHSLRYGDCPAGIFGGLPGAVLVAMPDGRELQAERPKELCDFLRIANALAGEPALGVFLFGLRLSVLDKVDAHITP